MRSWKLYKYKGRTIQRRNDKYYVVEPGTSIVGKPMFTTLQDAKNHINHDKEKH